MRPKPHAPENYVHAGLSWPPPAIDDKTNDTKPLETLAAQARATKIDFYVILRLSEALVCFRASGDNFLRSIVRAIVNKNDGKHKIDFLTSF